MYCYHLFCFCLALSLAQIHANTRDATASQRQHHRNIIPHLARQDSQQHDSVRDTSTYDIYSANATFSTKFRELGKTHPDYQAIQQVYPIIETFGIAFDKRVNEDHPRACNLDSHNWLDDLTKDLVKRNFPELDTECRSRLDSADRRFDPYLIKHLNESFIRTIYGKLSAASQAIARGISNLTFDNIDPGSVNKVHPLEDWIITRGSQWCNVQTMGAFRKYGTWYLRLGITNHNVNNIRSKDRLIFDEFVRADMKATLNSQLNVPGSERQKIVPNATTVYRESRGRAPWSIVEMSIDENYAMMEGLRLVELEVNQAEDALTPSNLAILALPIVLTFVPLAFIAELNDCATLLYVTFTDLFSVLPLLIKGIELYMTGSNRQSDMAAFHVGNKTFGWLELWSVQCAGSSKFAVAGEILMAVSVSAVFVGLLIEYIAWRVMKKRRKMGNGGKDYGKMKGPFGELYQSDSWLMGDPSRVPEYEYEYEYENDDILHMIEENGTLSQRKRMVRPKVVDHK